MCKGLTVDGVGVSKDTVLQEIRPGGGFETGDIAQEKLGKLPQNDAFDVNGVSGGTRAQQVASVSPKRLKTSDYSSRTPTRRL